MLETLDHLWDTPVQGYWIQVCWMMICAFWGLHTLLRIVHVVVTWPTDRAWRTVWIPVSLLCTLYFLGQLAFAEQRDTVTFGSLARNGVSLVLVVTLIIDGLRGIRGTATRRARRDQEARAQLSPPA